MNVNAVEITENQRKDFNELAPIMNSLSKTDKASIIGYINGIVDASRNKKMSSAETGDSGERKSA